MRIHARAAGVLDGLVTCSDCGGPMARVAGEYRCIEKVEPEELVAVGFVPTKEAGGKLRFEGTAKDQQSLQISQALSRSVEIDDTYLQGLGLDLDKIRSYQLKHNLVP
jgi:hypothetical protein